MARAVQFPTADGDRKVDLDLCVGLRISNSGNTIFVMANSTEVDTLVAWTDIQRRLYESIQGVSWTLVKESDLLGK